MILLDTNVISELMRPFPHPAVAAYFRTQRLTELFLPAVCEGEVRYGIARMPAGRRRDALAAAFSAFLSQGFRSRVIVYDSACAAGYAAVRTAREAVGRPVKIPDLLIAGTAHAHGAIIATRNVPDFDGCGITTVNPWATT